MVANALVTGGADSMGRAIAERLLGAGFAVHVADVRADALQDMLAANPGATGTVANVGNPDDVQRIFDDLAGRMPDLAALVNTVGIGGPRGPLEDITLDDWRMTMAVNVDGMFDIIRRATPLLKRAGAAAIVNVSTGSTRTRLPMRLPYIVSKYAVEGLTLNVARELGPHNVRCNAILPGMVDNARNREIMRRSAEATGSTIEDVEAATLRYISMRSKIAPSEIADVVAFLVSNAAAHVTGELIAVSGNLEWEE